MEAQLIPLVNADGSTTAVEMFEAASNEKPVLIIFPAMGMRAAYYNPFAKLLAERGFTAITSDLRGIGQSALRPSKKEDYGYHEMIEQDIATVVHYVREHFPSQKLFILGHSLGGQLGSLYAAKYPTNIDGLILIACCSVYYKGWRGLTGYRILVSTQMIGVLASTLGYFPGRKLGFGGTNAKTVMKDWSRQSRTGNYVPANDSFDYEEGLKKLELPIMALSFEGDNFSPVTAVNQLLKKFGTAKDIHQVDLKKSDPLNDKFNHFNWAKKGENIVRMVSEWLEQQN